MDKEIKNWKYDYMRLLLNLYDVNYKYFCPDIIKEASEEYLDNNNDIKQFLLKSITSKYLTDLLNSYQGLWIRIFEWGMLKQFYILWSKR